MITRNFNEILIKYHSKDIIYRFKSNNSLENLRQQMEWKDILVVDLNYEIIATGAIANFGNFEKPKFSISNFFVKPEMHRQGIGRTLFNELINIAIEKEVEILHVPSSRNAVGFYSSLGFVKEKLQLDIENEITWMSMRI